MVHWLVVIVATAVVVFTVVRFTVPIVLAPSLNVTVPVGGPPVIETVAVSVTVCLNPAGFGCEVRVIVGTGSGLTTCVRTADVLA